MKVSIYLNGRFIGRVIFNRSDEQRWPFKMRPKLTLRDANGAAWFFYRKEKQ